MEKGKHHSEETKQKLRLQRLGSKRSEETKKKIVEGLKGRKVSNETREKLRLSNVGKKRTIEQRKNMSVARKKAISEERVKPNSHWKGKKLSEKHRKNISLGGMGKVMSKEAKEKMSLAQKGNTNGIGNKSRTGQKRSLNEVIKVGETIMKGRNYKNIRDVHNKWYRNRVLERDNFVCQECGRREIEMHTHHIISVKECITTKQEHLIYDVNNGITLCGDCHRKLHSKIRGLK
jgi:5-methylcytosine-specific restriction endonuclease McrA